MSFSDEFLDENYNLIKVLGNGGFGRAYLAQCKKTKENFVIKDRRKTSNVNGARRIYFTKIISSKYSKMH